MIFTMKIRFNNSFGMIHIQKQVVIIAQVVQIYNTLI